LVESETITAYILVVTKVGREHPIKDEIEKIGQAMEGEVWVDVKPVFGEFDLIVIVEARSIRAIDKLVSQLRMLPGVEKTLTLIGSY